jgi:chromosome segregation ATPase
LQGEVAKAVAWARDREKEAEERGRRVVELQSEVAEATAWAKSRDAEVAEAIAWAKRGDAEVAERDERIVQMMEEYSRLEGEMAKSTAGYQASIAGYEAAIDEWRRAKEGADRWAMETESRLSAERDAAREAFAARGIELENSQQQLASAQAEAEQLRAQLAEATAKVEMIAQSRWVRLGRVVGAGPEIHRN